MPRTTDSRGFLQKSDGEFFSYLWTGELLGVFHHTFRDASALFRVLLFPADVREPLVAPVRFTLR